MGWPADLKTKNTINFEYSTGYSQVEKIPDACTRLGLGQVQVPPVGKNSCPCPSPSGQVLDIHTKIFIPTGGGGDACSKKTR
jgi:hypothetical protein